MKSHKELRKKIKPEIQDAARKKSEEIIKKIEKGIEQADNNYFMTDEEIDDLFKKFKI